MHVGEIDAFAGSITGESWADAERFEAAARAVFEYQRAENAAYRRYCREKA